LASEKLLIGLIKKELNEIKGKYSDIRRTGIIKDDTEAEIRTEDLIHVEECIVTLTRNQGHKKGTTKILQPIQ